MNAKVKKMLKMDMECDHSKACSKKMAFKKVKKAEHAGKKKKSSAKDGNFIQKAIKHPGALRKELHIKKGKTIPASKLKKAAKVKGVEGKRARLAITLRKLRSKKK